MKKQVVKKTPPKAKAGRKRRLPSKSGVNKKKKPPEILPDSPCDPSKSEAGRTALLANYGPAGGRPRKHEWDRDVLRRMAWIQSTQAEIGAALGYHTSWVSQMLGKDEEFRTIYDEARERGRSQIRQAQWDVALGGSERMLVWLGKQVLDQQDVQVREDFSGAKAIMNLIVRRIQTAGWDDQKVDVFRNLLKEALGTDQQGDEGKMIVVESKLQTK